MNSVAPNPEQMRLITRVLALHFNEGRLQSEIAKQLGLSAAKVNRLIKQGLIDLAAKNLVGKLNASGFFTFDIVH